MSAYKNTLSPPHLSVAGDRIPQQTAAYARADLLYETHYGVESSQGEIFGRQTVSISTTKASSPQSSAEKPRYYAREAWDHIAGFAPALDMGIHDFRDTDSGSMLRVKGTTGCARSGQVVSGVDPESKH